MSFGPRPTGSEANRRTGDYILDELGRSGWQTETQEFTYHGTLIRNIIGKNAIGQGPTVIIGAHYDTRMRADRDPVNPEMPVPGANDGASGVAVLLELARSLRTTRVHNEIWLAFFDAEDDGGISGWDWIVGSTYMAQHLSANPEAMILVDMIGDRDQQIYIDRNSDRRLSTQLFQIAADLGYEDHFIATPKHAMIDDHTPFALRGIPAVDLIDFDYPYWHTTADTIDKISAESLERVGRTLEAFLESSLTASAFLAEPRALLSCKSDNPAGCDATNISNPWPSFANSNT
jgi:Zn-dependent M28 family amino/carboxypeptidase